MNLERIRRILSEAVPKSASLAPAHPGLALFKKNARAL